MRTELEQALQQAQQGAVARAAEVVERIKELPRVPSFHMLCVA